LSKKLAILKIAHFLLVFAYFCSFALFERAIALFVTLFERANERLLFLSHFLKEQNSDCSFGPSLEKSEKRAIAHLVFCKEQQKERSLIRSFVKSNKKSDRSIAILKRVELSDEQMSNCPTLNFALSLFLKEERAIALFERVKE